MAELHSARIFRPSFGRLRPKRTPCPRVSSKDITNKDLISDYSRPRRRRCRKMKARFRLELGVSLRREPGHSSRAWRVTDVLIELSSRSREIVSVTKPKLSAKTWSVALVAALTLPR